MEKLMTSLLSVVHTRKILTGGLAIVTIMILVEFSGAFSFYKSYHTVVGMLSSENPLGLLIQKTFHPKDTPITNKARENNTEEGNTLELCSLIPPNLKERIPIVLTPLNFTEIEKMYPTVKPGGRWKPDNCTARNKIAIIIPYRNRTTHLKIFLRHMHVFLQKQLLDYGIFVIEQTYKAPFNRGLLMNVGFKESLKIDDFQCFFLHDVDLLPESELNLYTCPEQPRHLSVSLNINKYKVIWPDIFGGVSALTKEQMEKVNGFSNKFWGWGGEDDDLVRRVKYYKFKVLRYPLNIARYTMITHKSETPNPQRFNLLNQAWKRYATDGLNSLKYVILGTEERPLYTLLHVDADMKEV